MDASRFWPHFLVAKDESGVVRIGQYLPLDYSGRALKWGNRDGVIQVEIGKKSQKFGPRYLCFFFNTNPSAGGKAASPFTTHDPALTRAVSSLYQALSVCV